ncbi:MAG: type IV pilus secretin PilQ [Syntrophaceae bacterium]|nr:type IV pilus secretin PilQ [Syntrophaceae bacterium]
MNNSIRREKALIYTFCRKKLGWLICFTAMAILISGCAPDVVTKKDPFFEKWETMARTSAGHSPAAVEKGSGTLDMERKGEADPGIEKGKTAEKQLPTARINLKMRQADVKAVLRSLARIEGKNILIKNEVKGEITVDFKNVPWDQAFSSIIRNQALSYVWEGDVIRVLTLEDMEQDLKRKTQELGIRQVEPPLTRVININYADAKALKDNLQEFLTKDKDGKPRGSIRVDEHNNALIIQAIRDDLSRMLPLIEKLDKPTPQIAIKANIVEATKDTARNLGIQWGGMYNPRVGDHNLWLTPGGTTAVGSSPTNPISGGYAPSSNTAPGLSGQGFGVNFPVSIMSQAASGALGLMFGTIGGNILEVQLNALQIEGKLNILSSPSITTLDNQKAFTENGARVPYVTEEVSGGVVTRVVKFEDVVLRLEITPHVIDGKNLKMKILVKKDEVDERENNKVQGNPRIIKKQTETNLIVRDGETIVISGLTKHTLQEGESGIPGLKDLPVLGWLFKGTSKGQSMEEVLIFITPTILPVQTAAVITEGTEKKTDSTPKKGE